MKHYPSEQWLDRARGVAAADVVTGMERHLVEGCASCSEIADRMARLTEISKREALYRPPQEAVRNAKALMAMQRIASTPARESFVLQALFDSAQQALPAGVRGSASARQLLYQQDNCCIDVRLEAKQGRKVELIGQVLDSGAIGRGLNEIPISLQRGLAVLARTLTNHFGEFHFVLDESDDLHMIVDVTEDRRLIVPLPS